jgi:(S)-3,5-dihydroxyphenylglycine transaminase
MRIVDRRSSHAPRAVFEHPMLAGMNFLNEAASRYPRALSLASGRPDVRAVREEMPWLLDALQAPPCDRQDDALLQYGATAGIVCDVLADWIVDRTGASVDRDRVIVTTGCQEAMMIALLATCDPGTDALLVPTPTYLGILGAAMMAGIDVFTIGKPAAVDASAIERGVWSASRAGRIARALYLIPDHDNPTGESLGMHARASVMEAAARYGLVVFEDVAYREFGYDVATLPSLLSSDAAPVVQLGTFSKIIVPSIRLGYLATNRFPEAAAFITACEATKSFLTLNTATMTQLVLSHAIGAERTRLVEGVTAMRKRYRAKRDAVLDILGAGGFEERGVTWNVPSGGFFLTLHLPFAFGDAEMQTCAERFGVICTPMRYFALSGEADREVRVAFSARTESELIAAMERFAAFLDSVLG